MEMIKEWYQFLESSQLQPVEEKLLQTRSQNGREIYIEESNKTKQILSGYKQKSWEEFSDSGNIR